MVSAKSFLADKVLAYRQQLSGHDTITTQTATANLEGFSQILKEKSGEKSVFAYPIAIIQKY